MPIINGQTTIFQQVAEIRRKLGITGSGLPPHATTHENGGTDEIDVTGLTGILATPQTPATHAASHQNGGSDEISVLGLSGLLADDQTPLIHDIITKHNGFPGGTASFLRADATFAVPPDADTGITQLTGDVTAGPGNGSQVATIANDAVTTAKILDDNVTNAKLADMALNTIKGNNAALGNPLDLTVAQVNAILPVFTSLLNGLVPASGGGTVNFLRADGSFAVPPGAATASTAKQTEVDFGDVFSVNSQTFTITDASVSATSRIDCWLSGDAPTGKDADDVIAEDPLKFIVVPGAGTFDLYVEQPVGALQNKYKINYEILAP